MKYTPRPKRDPIKNYFQPPNEIFLLGLSPGALAVYSYLLCCENRKTYQCWPSYKTIGRAVRMSANTVRKYVCELEERQLISTESTTVTTKAGLKRNGNLLYTIRPIQLALDQFYEQQLSTKVEYRLWIAQPSAKRSLHKSYIWFDNFALNPTA